jgi:hypothetical protein
VPTRDRTSRKTSAADSPGWTLRSRMEYAFRIQKALKPSAAGTPLYAIHGEGVAAHFRHPAERRRQTSCLHQAGILPARRHLSALCAKQDALVPRADRTSKKRAALSQIPRSGWRWPGWPSVAEAMDGRERPSYARRGPGHKIKIARLKNHGSAIKKGLELKIKTRS